MPYIDKEKRGKEVTNAGELNYAITMLLIEYLKEKGESYQTMNDIIGVLECAKLEFARRVINPHEDKKIAQNGDVY